MLSTGNRGLGECRRLRDSLCAGMLIAAFSPVSFGAEFPVKPVRLVVPFAPGGSSDAVARMLGSKLSESWSHQVIVENRPGANSSIGTNFVARAAPDGYTLLLANANLTVNPALFKSLPYDSISDFSAVSQVANQTVVLLVHPSVPAKSVKQLIQLAKARPGDLNFASPGVGTASHMTGVLFQALSRIDMVFVPYKGAGPSLADLIGGQVTVGASGLTSSLQYIESGRVRALGVTTSQRSVLKPEIPTIAESGLPGFEVTNWFGVIAPARTPEGIVKILNDHMSKLMAQKSNEQLIFKLGLEPSPRGPIEFGAFIRSEIEKWIRVVREAGIKQS